MIGLGMIELLILCLIGLALVGIPLIVVIVVLSTSRRHQQSVACPKCGKLSPRTSFCPHCGAKSMKED